MKNHEHETKHHEVRIHIDQHAYHSVNPTTGEALYKLASVADGFKLYREVEGDREDEAISNSSEEIHLHEDAHFHSGPARHLKITIIVNTEEKTVMTKKVSYAEIITLAFPTPPVPPPGQVIDYTVIYRHGPHANPSGTMLENATLEIKDRMTFDVTTTFRS